MWPHIYTLQTNLPTNYLWICGYDIYIYDLTHTICNLRTYLFDDITRRVRLCNSTFIQLTHSKPFYDDYIPYNLFIYDNIPRKTATHSSFSWVSHVQCDVARVYCTLAFIKFYRWEEETSMFSDWNKICYKHYAQSLWNIE